MSILSTALAVLVVAPPQAPSLPDPADVAAVKDGFVFASDGQKHVVAFHKEQRFSGPVFYGDGSTFFQLRVRGGGAQGDTQFDMVLWDPRFPFSGSPPSFDLKDGEYSVSCGGKKTVFKLLGEDEAKAMREKAAFLKFRWRRQPYKLARDDSGTYYFVDKERDEEWGVTTRRDFRVFVGQRGKMAVYPMKNVVSDSEGEIFITKSGEMRFVTGQKGAKWVAGKKETKLIDVPVEDNAQMIYTELGPYSKEKLGTPCDDM